MTLFMKKWWFCWLSQRRKRWREAQVATILHIGNVSFVETGSEVANAIVLSSFSFSSLSLLDYRHYSYTYQSVTECSRSDVTDITLEGKDVQVKTLLMIIWQWGFLTQFMTMWWPLRPWRPCWPDNVVINCYLVMKLVIKHYVVKKLSSDKLSCDKC